MKLIGLTGGIGSGKTTVAQIFKTLGVPVLNADEQGRWLLANDMGVIDAVKNLFGEEVYVNGQPDRQAIAGRVFKDADLLERLNAIIHPAVRRRSDEWANSLPTDTAYALREAAILFESGANEQCVEVIAVHAPMDV
jgi:dephospho-CoA kinase